MKGILLALIFLSFALGHFEILAGQCPPGQIFRSDLNRCMLTETSVAERDEHTNCSEMDSGEAKDQCMKDAADKRAARTEAEMAADGEGRVSADDVESKGEGNLLTGFSEAWGIVSGITSATVMMSSTDTVAGYTQGTEGKGNNSADCKSCALLGAVSLYSFYQSKINKEDVKDKANEFKQEYEEITKDPESMKKAQLAAFDMLEKEQQYLAEISGKQEKQYSTLALGYTAAAALAVYEIWETLGTSCAGGDDSNWNFGDGMNGLRSLTNNPCAIIAGSVITIPSALTISQQAKKNKMDAENNVAQVKELKKKYVHSVAALCPDGREDMSKPACYCYTSKGEQNQNRKKSKTCQDFWNRYSGSYIASTDASRARKATNPEGCLFVDGKFDRECNCRKLKNSKGENACRKITVAPTSLAALGGLDVSEALKAANAATQGNASSYNANTTSGQAAMALKTLDNIKKKIAGQFKKTTGVSLDKSSKGIAKALGRYGDKNNVAIFNGAGEQFARIRPTLPTQMQEVVASVEKKLPRRGVIVRKSSSKKAHKKSANKWRFDDSSSTQVLSYGEGAGEGDSKKRYDYGDNDIIKDKSVSIFKVISHRYVQSGLKKLFSE